MSIFLLEILDIIPTKGFFIQFFNIQKFDDFFKNLLKSIELTQFPKFSQFCCSKNNKIC